MGNEVLSMNHISKVYPNGVMANKDINFSVDKGEIHALSGENGAGKSTLMKILFGEERSTSGSIRIDGKEVQINSPQDALALGIGMVHQHFMLVPSLTVTENIILGMEKRKGLGIDYSYSEKLIREMGDRFSMNLNPKAKVRDLSVGQKQKLEILKILVRGAKILILDEPTAVLTPQETVELFKELKHLKEEGFTVIFISHKLDEVRELCDRISIIRHGESVGVFNLCDVTNEEISRLMVGRNVELKIKKERARKGEKMLCIQNVTAKDDENREVISNLSFNVHSGEIFGVAGVEGNGQSELVEAITGLRHPSSGSIKLNDTKIGNCSIKEIRAMGLSHIPEDRMTIGIASNMSIAENIVSDKLNKKEFFRKGMINSKEIDSFADERIKEFNILCKDNAVSVSSLSGGNIQKVVLARELSSSPKLVIADQPTRGVDVGASELIRTKLVKLRDEGNSVLLVSSDLSELLNLSDRIMVMYKGKAVAFLSNVENLTSEDLGRFMLGLDEQSPEELEEGAR